MRSKVLRYGIAASIILAILYVAVRLPCYPPPNAPAEPGSHGYRVWMSESYRSFEHFGQKVCVEEGWRAVGETNAGEGWAEFDPRYTAVLIKSDAFTSESLTVLQSSYDIELLTPLGTPSKTRDAYRAIVSSTFTHVGTLFGDTRTDATRPHAVLVTPGIDGTGFEQGLYLYPDPHERISVLVREPEHPRAEELFIHAIMHLYNRHAPAAYKKDQPHVSSGDFEELEATWAETAFRSSHTERIARLQYLYNVHRAVTERDFSKISRPPFNDKAAFDAMRRGSVTPAGNRLDIEYGHYVLGPLAMVATDGLLMKYGLDTNVATLLTHLHTGRITDYFAELEKVLPSNEAETIRGWMLEGKSVPLDLVLLGASRYR